LKKNIQQSTIDRPNPTFMPNPKHFKTTQTLMAALSILLLLAATAQVDIQDIEASSTEKKDSKDPVSLEGLSPALQQDLEASPHSETHKTNASANQDLIRKLEIPFHIIYIFIGFPL
jgi:hypothetical protein